MKRFKVAPEIYYEKDAINYIEKISGEKAFIVTDPTMLKIGIADQVTRILEKKSIPYEVFSDTTSDPTLETITDGLQQFIGAGCDLLIAVGGGSVLDTAKAIIYLAKRVDAEGIEGQKKNKRYFVAIPTTSGTGSEVSSYTVITDTKRNVKVTIQGDEMFPDLALLDCELVRTVPPSVTAETGLDILAHAVEAYVSKEASDYTDALAQKSIEFVFQYLVNCYKNGDDQFSREKIHNACCMAGMAFENASLGINHSLAHVFGAKFKIPHGKANAVLLPYVIKYNSGLFDDNENIDFETAHKYVKLARLLELPASDLKEGVVMLAKSIKVLNTQLHIPLTIKEMGIDQAEFESVLPQMCKIAMEDICTRGNPRVPTETEISCIFREAYHGRKHLPVNCENAGN